ncbi:hypothetical protein [uncultured Aquimarina sp.]|uniref:hypothetical protein n=1 Tax=uncultured Aquimarina sp. TaxID=575652 RepID=UPI002601F9C1|nr:hypothetical protein [uncultured Aquimarina sp.]
MLKNISNLGKKLSKVEQQSVKGGIGNCQQRLFNLTAEQCAAQNGNYTTSGYCVVTIEGCQAPFLSEGL